jgi:hypothetical protein
VSFELRGAMNWSGPVVRRVDLSWPRRKRSYKTASENAPGVSVGKFS